MTVKDIMTLLESPDRVRVIKDGEEIYNQYFANMEVDKDIVAQIGDAEVKRFRAIPEITHRKYKERGLIAPMKPEETPDYSFACDELHFATGAQAMIHKPLCMAWGNADDFKEVIKQLDLCEDSILDVYEEHLKEGVTRDKIKSFMAKEKWFSGAELAEYFDVLIDEKAAVAACASDYFEKYNHVPESIKGTATKDIVDAVLAELENRNNAAAEAEKQRIEAEKQDILADLDMYGI